MTQEKGKICARIMTPWKLSNYSYNDVSCAAIILQFHKFYDAIFDRVAELGCIYK